MRLLAIFALLPLYGCLGGSTLESWKGRTADSLIYAWGPPSQQAALPDGRRVLTYSTSQQFEGSSMYCQALFRLDSAGVVVEAEADGNIGGCNRLLLGKPSAK